MFYGAQSCCVVCMLQEYYPVNYLRNAALAGVETEYTFVMDVDFVPSANLRDVLMSAEIQGLFNGRNMVGNTHSYVTDMCILVHVATVDMQY